MEKLSKILGRVASGLRELDNRLTLAECAQADFLAVFDEADGRHFSDARPDCAVVTAQAVRDAIDHQRARKQALKDFALENAHFWANRFRRSEARHAVPAVRRQSRR